MRKLYIVLFSVLLMGCSNEYMAPEGTYSYTPPAEWKVWWNEAQPCINRTQKNRWEEVHWYIVPGYIQYEGKDAAGLASGMDIYISDIALNNAYELELRRTVVHELVHVLDDIREEHPYYPFHYCKLMSGQHYEDPTP